MNVLKFVGLDGGSERTVRDRKEGEALKFIYDQMIALGSLYRDTTQSQPGYTPIYVLQLVHGKICKLILSYRLEHRQRFKLKWVPNKGTLNIINN